MNWQAVVVTTHVVVVDAENEADARDAVHDEVAAGNAGDGNITILSVDEM